MSQKITQSDSSSEKTNSRRKFLVKTAVGSAALAVPGKSVWGTCSVSGAMSGNVSKFSEEQKCRKPDINGGCSPGTWKDAVDGSMNGKRLKSMFSVLDKQPNLPAAEAGSILWVAYEKHLQSVINSNSMQIDRRLMSSDVSYFNGGIPLSAALSDPGGVDYNLAAVWLNVYFGFYPSIINHSAEHGLRVAKANELVNEIAVYLFTEAKIAMSSPAMFGGTELVGFNYNFESEASTNYGLSDIEDNEHNRTTKYGFDEDHRDSDEDDTGRGRGKGRKGRW